MKRAFFLFDIALVGLTSGCLIISFILPSVLNNSILAALSFLGLIPVAISALKSLIEKSLSVDLLASIALIFSLLLYEWKSAAFITLMLAFARIFESVTEARVNRVIKSLMKLNVETVRLMTVGEGVKDVNIRDVRPGDLVAVESGDRMPVDGVVVSGTASIDESTLTGESEPVPKKTGDKVFTSTTNESGSLVVRAELVGEDTTLSRIVKLVEESSRAKSKAERMANRFTQWYILLSLLAAGVMYMLHLPAQVILAILLVVCADDVAVAVPLAFTASIARAAKRGVIVKGSAAFEQLSKIKYILTDKTGTLTTGRPKIVDIRPYGSFLKPQVLEFAMMGSAESKHAVSNAIAQYGKAAGATIHAPQEYEEISGQGVRFSHGTDKLLMGRPSFLEDQHVSIPEEIKREIAAEKDTGHGVAVLSVNGNAAGLITYSDDLRPHLADVIAETKTYGVREWHMLTGDNELAAAAVSRELGIKHFHSGMTPESKVAFVGKFELEHKPEVVAYIGDGVNDAASLALADVGIAMGGIGSDVAIEAADITIMKDRLERLPETMGMAKKVMRIMWQNFGIWGLTNVIGLSLVGFGMIGPVGAATYNFLTDFIPIGNALRAGKK